MDGFLHDISWVLPLRSETATHIANAFTWLGYPQFFIALLPVIYWLIDKNTATRIAMVVIFTGVTNGLLKDIFDDPRPPGEIFALDGRVDKSYGMPSGHAQVAFALWLWLALELKQRWFWAVAIVFAFGVTLSRLYLGVHDVEDVLSGAAIGIGSIFLLRWFFSPTFNGWRAVNPAIQLCLILGFEAVLWYAWPEEGGPGTKFAVGGMLLGWWMGVQLEQRNISYQRHPDWLTAIAATILGVIVIFLALPAIEPTLMAGGMEKHWARWAAYFVTAVWVTAAAPVIFQWLGAARKAET
ncbi:MAG: phosphatase PAP2 family protein [Micropepsaceae bacterium]